MLDEATLDAIQVIAAEMQTASADTAKQIFANPTTFIQNSLAGSRIELPAGFHAHVVERREELPDEPLLGTSERYVHFFGLNGTIETSVIPGSPHGDDAALQASTQCCSCLFSCCVIQVPKTGG